MSDIKPNSNICLTFEPSAATIFENIAQTSFQSSAYGYCLGPNIFPHVTLAQLHITDKERKQDILNWLSERSFEIGITLDNFDISFRSPGVMWCHFSVHKSDALMSLQKEMDGYVKSIGLEPLNPSLEAYYPHVTIARLKTGTPIPSFEIPEKFIEGTFVTKAIYGPSDELGQLLGYRFND